MERKENTPGRESRRRYEERNKEKRKATSGNFGTMIPRALYEEINVFLTEHGLTKVKLIEAGYSALKSEYGPKKQKKQKIRRKAQGLCPLALSL